MKNEKKRKNETASGNPEKRFWPIFAFCLWPFWLNLAPMTSTMALVALALFAGASFFFALAETSLFSLGKWQLRQLESRSPALAQDHQPPAAPSRRTCWPRWCWATASPTPASSPSLFCWPPRHGWPLSAVLAALLALILFGGEVAPKTLAVRAPEFWALRVARPMLLLQRISRPLRRVAQGLTNLSLRAFPSPALAARRPFRRRVPGVARNGLSAGRAGGGRKGNHPPDHQSGPPPCRRRDEGAGANGVHLRTISRCRKWSRRPGVSNTAACPFTMNRWTPLSACSTRAPCCWTRRRTFRWPSSFPPLCPRA